VFPLYGYDLTPYFIYDRLTALMHVLMDGGFVCDGEERLGVSLREQKLELYESTEEIVRRRTQFVCCRMFIVGVTLGVVRTDTT